MAVTHHGYNVLKMPGNRDIITIACEEKDAVCSLKRAYQAAVVEDPDNEGTIYPPEAIPKKKKQLLRQEPQENGVSTGTTSRPAPSDGAPPSLA
jgi:hypothetical protein